MKKIIISFLFAFTAILSMVLVPDKVSALDVFDGKNRVKTDIGVNFERIKSVSNGHLLSYYTDEQLNELALKYVMKRKMFGTRIKSLNTAKIDFRYKTLFTHSNMGFKETMQEIEIKDRYHKKHLFTFGRNNKYDLKATSKGYSVAINKSLSLNYELTLDIEKVKTQKTKITIEPGIKLTHSIEGVATVVNGAISNYIFWIRSNYGIFEYCVVNSYYEQILKERIYEI